MVEQYGIIGQEIFDMLCEGASAPEVYECLLRYLPETFGTDSDSVFEREHGIGKVMDILISSHTLSAVNVPSMIELPQWTSRFYVHVDFRLRFKPAMKSEARLLPRVNVRVRAENAENPCQYEDVISRKFSDIDEAYDVIAVLV